MLEPMQKFAALLCLLLIRMAGEGESISQLPKYTAAQVLL